MGDKPLTIKEGVKLDKNASARTYTDETEGLVYNNNDSEVRTQIGGADREVVTDTGSQTLTNKTIDVSANTVSSIANANIDPNAAIDATKVADGSVSNAEYQYLANVTSDIQGQLDDKTGLTAFGVHTVASASVHGVSGVVVGTSDTQTLTNKTIDADANTITNIENANIKVGAAIDAAKVHNGSVSNTEYGYLANVTSDIQGQLNDKTSLSSFGTHTAASSSIHGVTGSVLGTTDSQTLTNKTIDANSNTISNLEHGAEVDNPSSGVHGVTGSVVGTTDTQTLTNKTIDVSLNTVSSITNSNIDVNAAIDAAKIHNGNVSNTEFGYLANVTSDVQTQIDGKVSLGDFGTHTVASTSVHGVTGTVVGTSDTQTLTNKTFDDAVTHKQVTTPSNPASGYDKLYFKSDDKLYKLNSSGTEEAIGTGSGGGSVDFLSTKAISDYNTYNDGSVAVPVDGTGGTASYVSVAEETVSPISNASNDLNIKISKTANNAQGEGISVDFSTRGEIDRASIVSVNLESKESANYADGDFAVFLYDVTNSTLIYPADQDLNGSTLVAPKTFSFQTSADSDSYRLIFHCASTNASAYDITAVVKVNPQEPQVKGSPDIYLGELPTTGSWTTNTTYTGKYWRNGDYLKAEVEIDLAGAPNATNLLINYPAGYTPDTAKMNAVQFLTSLDGEVKLLDASASNRIDGRLIYDTTTYARVTSFLVTGTRIKTDTTSNTNPFTFASGDKVIIKYKIPIVGWSSNMVLSEDAGNRLITSVAGGIPSSTLNGSFNNVVFPTATNNDVGIYNSASGELTLSESGYYFASSNVEIQCTPTARDTMQLRIYNNTKSSVVGENRERWDASLAALAKSVGAYGLFYGNKGDVITVQALSNSTSPSYAGGSTANNFSVFKLASPQTIATSEKVSGFANTTGAANGNISNATYTQIIFDNAVDDTHASLNTSTGVITAKRSGKLSLHAAIQFADNNGWAAAEQVLLRVTIGGSAVLLKTTDIFTNVGAAVTVPCEVSLLSYPIEKGDEIEVEVYHTNGSAIPLITGGAYNHISWEIS